MIVAALSIALGISAPARLQSVAPDTVESIILEIALGRLTSTTVTAFRAGQRALVPVADFFSLAEVRVTASADSTVDARLEPRGVPVRVDLKAGRVIVDGVVAAIGPGQAIAANGQVYLDAELLGRALGLVWTVNWPDLSATVVDPSALPIAQRITRDWQRRQRQQGTAENPSIRRLPSERRVVDGWVVDYSAYAPAASSLRDASFSVATGFDLLNGSATASFQNQTGGTEGGVRADLAWTGVWRDNPWLRQLRVGDGLASGPRPRTVRGITIGNSPYLRSNEFGEVSFTGELGPGWQVEAYRGGRLIDFDSVNALGRFRIDAPIAYGENPLELVAYGPFGEIRRLDRTYRVDPNRLPARRFEYGAAFGQCRTGQCSTTANVDIRFGLTNRWTLSGGMDHFGRADSLGNLAHPYLGVAGALTNSLALQLEAVANAVLRTVVRYEPSTRLILTAEGTRFARDVRAPILTPGERTGQLTLAGVVYPSVTAANLFVDGSLDVIRTTSATMTSGRIGVSLQAGPVQLLPTVRWQQTRQASGRISSSTVGLNGYLLPTPQLGPFLGQLTTRVAAESRLNLAPEHLAVYASRTMYRNVRVEAGTAWRRQQGVTASLSIAANLASVRSVTNASSGRLGTTASQFVQGSLLYDRRARRLQMSAGPSLERGGVTGRVFLDHNGNSRFDEGEDLLPNVRVTVGMETRQSDRRGEYRLWNVTPFEEAVIAVDSTTLESPLWLPTYDATTVAPSPNRYRVVDIPIIPGGLVEGRVVRVDSLGEHAVAGVPLRLIEQTTGASRRLTTFADGAFYTMGVKPGRYALWVDLEYATRFGLAVRPFDVEIAASAEGTAVSGIVIRLEPR